MRHWWLCFIQAIAWPSSAPSRSDLCGRGNGPLRRRPDSLILDRAGGFCTWSARYHGGLWGHKKPSGTYFPWVLPLRVASDFPVCSRKQSLSRLNWNHHSLCHSEWSPGTTLDMQIRIQNWLQWKLIRPMIKPYFEIPACRDRKEIICVLKVKLPMCTYAPLQHPPPPPPNSNCLRWITLGLVLEGSISDVLFLPPHLFFFKQKNHFHFIVIKHLIWVFVLKTTIDFKWSIFLKKNLRKRYWPLSFSALLVICCLLGSWSEV